MDADARLHLRRARRSCHEELDQSGREGDAGLCAEAFGADSTACRLTLGRDHKRGRFLHGRSLSAALISRDTQQRVELVPGPLRSEPCETLARPEEPGGESSAPPSHRTTAIANSLTRRLTTRPTLLLLLPPQLSRYLAPEAQPRPTGDDCRK